MPDIRTFSTGATRDGDTAKPDFEGFLSPFVLEAYGRYMTEHRRQSDGTVRASDNWQRGITLESYRSSLIRHVITAWRLWRGGTTEPEMIGGVRRVPTLLDTLMAILFNTMGMAHELLKAERERSRATVSPLPPTTNPCQRVLDLTGAGRPSRPHAWSEPGPENKKASLDEAGS